MPVLEKNGMQTYQFLGGEITNQNLIENQAEFLIVRSTTKVNEKLLKNTKIKFVATATAGIEHIDIEFLQKNNIEFFAASGSNSNSVAEYVIFAILFWLNKFDFINDLDFLKEIKVGIIGFGNIGTKVAKYLDFMKIKYLINDPIVENNEKIKSQYQNIKFCKIDEIIENSNIITTHIPLTFPENSDFPTFNLLNSARIKKIQSNSLLISTSRHSIFDENEMLKRFEDNKKNSKKKINFILDVFENEPFVKNRKLIDYSLLSTPHLAGHSLQGKLNGTLMILKKLNELYNFNFDYSEIEKKAAIYNSFKINEMTNLKKIFNCLFNSRKLFETSEKMKKNVNLSDEEFAKYFKNERKNYSENSEILSLI
jgi:erythronate-4-phosphate dehydrogenase